MNTQSTLTRPGERHTAAVAAILMALSGMVPVATIADQPATAPAVSRVADVALADLDLATAEGLRVARDRLHTMARRLCAELARGHDLSYQPNFAACVHDTLAGALAQANVLAAAKNTRTARGSAP